MNTAPETWTSDCGTVTLYCGDCLEVMPTLSGVDAVVTDPPYGLVNEYGDHRSDRGTRIMDFGDLGTLETGLSGWRAALSTCKDDGFAFAFTGDELFAPARAALRGRGFCAKQFAWVKKCPMPAGKNVKMTNGFELATFGFGGGAWVDGGAADRVNVKVFDSYRHGQPGKVGHPTQKPLGLVEWIVATFCVPGGAVLDPFMGSGTTGVAAVNAGRRFIGVELDPTYFAIAKERIQKALAAKLVAA